MLLTTNKPSRIISRCKLDKCGSVRKNRRKSFSVFRCAITKRMQKYSAENKFGRRIKRDNPMLGVDNTPEYVSSDIQKRYSKRANLLYLLRSKIADRISMITSGVTEYRNRSINTLLYDRGNKHRINRLFTGIKFGFYSTDKSGIPCLAVI